MAAAKIRVYELARELGLTNKEMLDLAESLGIGVKSHSSSIEEAQADRARRKADQLGIRRDVSPPEPEPAKKAKAAKKAAPAEAPPDGARCPGPAARGGRPRPWRDPLSSHVPATGHEARPPTRP